MKKSVFLFFAFVATCLVVSCNDTETYAEQRDREDNAIREYIKDMGINTISESQFREQGYTTDLSRNEYVLITSSGVYVQIVRKGCGSPLSDGETATVLCRFTERSVFADTITLSNNVASLSYLVDKMTVTRSSDSFTAQFLSGQSIMYSVYGSQVPAGWLQPLNFINIGRPSKPGDEIAKVRLIVPSAQGTSSAISAVAPFYYEITYEKGI